MAGPAEQARKSKAARAGAPAALAIGSVRALVGAALAVGARRVPTWSNAERKLARGGSNLTRDERALILEAIAQGQDPLGTSYCTLHSPAQRRARGCTFTPPNVVQAMLNWCARAIEPATVVDPGTGSARFLVAAGRRFPQARLIGIEIDPLTALVARGHLAAAGMVQRATVLCRDFREMKLNRLAGDGPTLFVGNPPYVRHHQISAEWKKWFADTGRSLGLRVSALAGSHAHFLFAIAKAARPGDALCLITAAEWLDVNYGQALRQLLLSELGGEGVIIIEPRSLPFADAATTGAIITARPGSKPRTIRFRRTRTIDADDDLTGGRSIARDQLVAESKWSGLGKARRSAPRDFIELGEICGVHRGQATGANAVWVFQGAAPEGLSRHLYPTVTQAKELYDAGIELRRADHLRRVLDLPADLDCLPDVERRAIDAFLADAKRRGADRNYIARHRRPWWRVGLREPAPILATYMARRIPAFVVNRAEARHLNIAHGLYPRIRLSRRAMRALAESLTAHTRLESGRTYAGGLTKFEPREMERILVPRPGYLEQVPEQIAARPCAAKRVDRIPATALVQIG